MNVFKHREIGEPFVSNFENIVDRIEEFTDIFISMVKVEGICDKIKYILDKIDKSLMAMHEKLINLFLAQMFLFEKGKG